MVLLRHRLGCVSHRVKPTLLLERWGGQDANAAKNHNVEETFLLPAAKGVNVWVKLVWVRAEDASLSFVPSRVSGYRRTCTETTWICSDEP